MVPDALVVAGPADRAALVPARGRVPENFNNLKKPFAVIPAV
jgi:hypothetical protein